MTMRQRVVTTERSVALWAVVATGARNTLRSSNSLLRGVQQTIQHLADRTVFAVEWIRIHGWFLLRGLIFEETRALHREPFRPFKNQLLVQWHLTLCTLYVTDVTLSRGTKNQLDNQLADWNVSSRAQWIETSQGLRMNTWSIGRLYIRPSLSAAFGRARQALLTDVSPCAGMRAGDLGAVAFVSTRTSEYTHEEMVHVLTRVIDV